MDDDHDHDHDHDHGHEHDHSLIVDRLPAGSWRVDPEGSEVLFRARTLRVVPVHGLFRDFSGELEVAEDGAASGTLLIQTGSLDTRIARRDRTLRGPQYLDAQRHPTATFTLARIEPSGREHLNVTGTLQLAGHSVPLSLEAYAIAHGDHLHLEAQTPIDQTAAGLGWAKPGLVGNTVRAEVALTLTRA